MNSWRRRSNAQGGVEAWIVDDTGFPKKGSHSVGVARQYCGRLGKTDNCQIAVTLSIANHHVSLPIAYRLYLPETWANDAERRGKGACSRGRGVSNQAADRALSDRGGGEGWRGARRRAGRRRLRLRRRLPRRRHGAGADLCGGRAIDAVGLASRRGAVAAPSLGAGADARLRAFGATAIIGPSRPKSSRCACPPRPGKTWSGAKAPTKLCLPASPRSASGRPRATASSPSRIQSNGWSSNGPRARRSLTKYWLSTLPEDTPLEVLVDVIKLRWRIERDYEELKSELGLAHFEGRGWRGFHHHASLCIAAYGFLILERSAFPPSARWRREKPALSGRTRSSRAADPSRKARSQLDRDDAKAIDDRARKIALSMPVLSRRLDARETSINACDAVEVGSGERRWRKAAEGSKKNATA